MRLADHIQCHFLQGLFHWQRATYPRLHPFLVWSISNDWFTWKYKRRVISVQCDNSFSFRQAILVLELPVGSAEAIVGLHYDLTFVPSCVLSFPFSGIHPKGISSLQVKLWCSVVRLCLCTIGCYSNHGTKMLDRKDMRLGTRGDQYMVIAQEIIFCFCDVVHVWILWRIEFIGLLLLFSFPSVVCYCLNDGNKRPLLQVIRTGIWLKLWLTSWVWLGSVT